MSGMRLSLRGLAAIALTLPLLAACSVDDSWSDTRPTSAGLETTSSPDAGESPVPAQYDEGADAVADIEAALHSSRRDGKPVLIDFGANWCPDSRQLGELFQKPAISRLLTSAYHLVLVDVGELDTNLDVAARYVELRNSGLPALAVVHDGRTVYASDRGEFAIARTMRAPELRAFLERWAA